MSTFDNGAWVQKALADDTIVADHLLRLRDHQPYLRRLLTHWTVRHRRSPRTNVVAVATRASTAVDQNETETETAVPSRSMRQRAMDQSETAPEKSSKKLEIVMNKSKIGVVKKIPNRKLYDLVRDVKVKRAEKGNLNIEMEAMKLAHEKETATNEMLKKRKLDLMSQMPIQTSEATLSPPQFVEVDDSVATNLASPETVKDNAVEDTALVSAASESVPLEQQEIDDGAKEASPLPDLNVPPEEYFTDFVLN